MEQDTESYLNKGCEEDIPSDSTAVLGQEVRSLLVASLAQTRIVLLKGIVHPKVKYSDITFVHKTSLEVQSTPCSLLPNI